MLNRIIGLAMIATGQPSATYQPEFDPSRLKVGPEAQASELAVLATTHLSNMPEDFDVAHLAPLIERLAAWQPRLVMIESISGAQCDYMRLHEQRYRPAGSLGYCHDMAPAQQSTGLDTAAATAEAERLLTTWPASPSPAQRRRLAAVFLASGQRASALVQWLRLPSLERRMGDGITSELAELLEGMKTVRNEDFLIAAPLAARLGLERVHQVDDHTADFASSDPAGSRAAMRRIWNNHSSRRRRALFDPLFENLHSSEGVMALYRALNGTAEMRLAYEGDFGAAMNDIEPPHHGAVYGGRWETRNLRMVANIREVLTMNPGQRALAIVGASHKGYYEAYLNMMHAVRLVDARSIFQ